MLTVPKFNGISHDPQRAWKSCTAEDPACVLRGFDEAQPIILDDAGLHEQLTDKVIMVTGAGGSIGSELCRQIAAYQPSMLVLFEQSEFALYKIEQSLRDAFENLPIASVIGDIKMPSAYSTSCTNMRPLWCSMPPPTNTCR